MVPKLRIEEGPWDTSDMSPGMSISNPSGWLVISDKGGFAALLHECRGGQNFPETKEGRGDMNM
jgi:hypothetical protein